MRRLKEKTAYQWQVLGWRGSVAMAVLFAGILSAYFDACVCVKVAVESSDWFAALVGILCVVAGAILVWAANWLFKEYEKYI